MAKYRAKIKYRIKKTHPDIGCVKDWTPKKVFEIEDVYTFQEEWFSEDYEKDYMRHDLALVAGGGYSTNHISNVKYEIEKIA